MLDNDVEVEFERRLSLARVVEQVRKVQAMTPKQRRVWQLESAKRVRELNEEFCRRFPEKCSDEATPEPGQPALPIRCCEKCCCGPEYVCPMKPNQPCKLPANLKEM